MSTKTFAIVFLAFLLNTASAQQWSGNANTTDLIWRSGNVGIGVQPQYKLHHASFNNTTNASALLWGQHYGAVIGVQGSSASYYAFGVYNGMNENGAGSPVSLFMVRADGNVGVGTTSPAAKLHVAEGGFRHGGTGEINVDAPGVIGGRLKILDNGNVGIGISTPNFKLHVSGQVAAGVSYLETMLDVGSQYTRSNFGSNVYRDVTANRWQVGAIGNNDFSSIIHPNADGLAFITAPSTGNVARSLTHSEFMGYERMRISSNGNVGIGTASPNQKLTVNGTIYGKEVKVDLNVPGPDYVFEENYDLPSLTEVEKYIKENKHLPEVPSAKEMEMNGIDLSDMNMLLLKKVEELTLHVIELNNLAAEQQKKLEDQEKQIQRLLQK